MRTCTHTHTHEKKSPYSGIKEILALINESRNSTLKHGSCFILQNLFILCVLPASICAYNMHIWCLQGSEGIRFPEVKFSGGLSCCVNAGNQTQVFCKSALQQSRLSILILIGLQYIDNAPKNLNKNSRQGRLLNS